MTTPRRWPRSSASCSNATHATTASWASASADEAATLLDDLAGAGPTSRSCSPVSGWPGRPAASCSTRSGGSHPHARRALLIDWGDWGQNPTGEAIFDGIAHGCFDHYVVRPDRRRRTSTSTSRSRACCSTGPRTDRAAPYTVHIVGESWSGRAYELREALQQCALPHHFCLADSAEGRRARRRRRRGRRAADHGVPERRRAGEPHQRRDRRGRRGAGRARRRHRVRPRHRRRRAGRAVGRGVRRLRGAEHPGRRPGRHRRSGDLELAHPQLPRASPGASAVGSSPGRPTTRPGSSVPGSPSCRRVTEHRAATATGSLVTLSDGSTVRTTGGAARDGRPLPPPRRAVARGADRRRGLLRRPDLGGAGPRRAATCSSSAAPTPPGRPCSTSPATPAGSRSSSGASSLRAGMSEYLVSQVEATPNIEVRLGTEVVGGGGRRPARAPGAARRRVRHRDDRRRRRPCSCSSAPSPTPTGCPPTVARDPRGFVLTGADLPRRGLARSSAAPFAARDEHARACSPPATCGTVR